MLDRTPWLKPTWPGMASAWEHSNPTKLAKDTEVQSKTGWGRSPLRPFFPSLYLLPLLTQLPFTSHNIGIRWRLDKEVSLIETLFLESQAPAQTGNQPLSAEQSQLVVPAGARPALHHHSSRPALQRPASSCLR